MTQEPFWPVDEEPGEEADEAPRPTGINLQRLLELMAELKVNRVLAKTLAANDNSKQQVYVSPGFEGLNLLPNAGVLEAPSRGRAGVIYYATLSLAWINENGEAAFAASPKLILYPQYPEVRLSGFLRGARFSPNAIMTSRQDGRVLFLGIRDADGSIFAYADTADSRLAAELRSQPAGPTDGVFRLLAPSAAAPVADFRADLLRELRDLAARGWVPGTRRVSKTATVECNSRNCGGYTLESELRIVANAKGEPDYKGVWELKAHSDRVVTLMDKKPTLGYFATAGFVPFMEIYGYDPLDVPNPHRRNFGGVYRVGAAPLRNLELKVIGYNSATGPDLGSGRVALVHTTTGEEALAYPFLSLMNHWKTKHTHTAYIDYQCEIGAIRKYRYGPTATLCEGTDPLRVIQAIAKGKVYLDHSPWLLRVPGQPAKRKGRYMIRFLFKDIGALYDRSSTERLT